MGDMIVIGIVAVLMILATFKIVSDKKKGIGSCGHRCSECASAGACGSSMPNEKFKEFLENRK